jgi:hypothetical protein
VGRERRIVKTSTGNDDDARALAKWELQMTELEERLRPIAQRPVDVTRPGWVERLQAGPPPLDEAGVRHSAERLLEEMIDAYAQSTEVTRSAIRRLFTEYRSFAWAATLSTPWTSVAGLRQHLILFSMQDQGRDSRDALLTLQEICREAVAAGVDTAPVLREVAELSSSANKYGMGSTRDMLLKHCPAR